MVTLSRSLLYLEMLWLEFRGLVRILYQKQLEGVRGDVDSISQRVFDHASRIAETSGISVSMPRVSTNQRHH